MCTSEPATPRMDQGFSLVELLWALVLTGLLISSVGPCWIGLQKAGIGQSDRAIAVVQGRVASARLEQDLRQAGTRDVSFKADGPLLRCEPNEVVFIAKENADAPPKLLEWEVSSGKLMRRWGSCPVSRPQSITHSLYADNKSMIEGVASGAGFHYVLIDGAALSSVPADELYLVDKVQLEEKVVIPGGVLSAHLLASALVGR